MAKISMEKVRIIHQIVPIMKIRYAFLLLFFALGCSTTKKVDQIAESEWIDLFNGKDLTGWDIKIAGHELNDNYKNTFKIKPEGILAISYDEYEQFDDKYGHLYYEQPFSHYKLKFDYRFLGEQIKGGAPWNVRNSGVMIHSQSAQSNSLKQHFPVSVEVQLLGGLNEGERHTANICTPGTYVERSGQADKTHCIDSNSKTYHGDQWVSVEVIVLGDSIIHHIVERDTVITYHKPRIDKVFVNEANYNWETAYVNDPQSWMDQANQLIPSGYIALQAESHAIDFKEIKLLNLKGCTDPKAKNYKAYYQASDNSTCIY